MSAAVSRNDDQDGTFTSSRKLAFPSSVVKSALVELSGIGRVYNDAADLLGRCSAELLSLLISEAKGDLSLQHVMGLIEEDERFQVFRGAEVNVENVSSELGIKPQSRKKRSAPKSNKSRSTKRALAQTKDVEKDSEPAQLQPDAEIVLDDEDYD